MPKSISKSSAKSARRATAPKAPPKSGFDFAQMFFAQIPAEDRALLTSAQQSDLVATHTKLAARAAGTTQIAWGQCQGKTGRFDDRFTTLDIVCDDMAFVVDSVAALLGARHLMIDLLLHPRMQARLERGRMVLDPAGSARQSHMHVRIKGFLEADQRAALEIELRDVITDVHFATRDWQDMRRRALAVKTHLTGDPVEHGELSEFLDYLYDNNFTFLGCRDYRFEQKGGRIISHIVPGSGLGVLSDDKFPAYISETKQPLPQPLQAKRLEKTPLYISKVNRISTVHRRVPLDAVAVQHVDAKGAVVGETLFVGLFTSVTYSRSLRSIPFLKYKADQVLKKSGFEPASHDGRALRHILEKYPRDELFQIDVADLHKICLSILRLQERQRIALYTRCDPFGRYVSCLVYIPRDRFDTHLRLKFQHILESELGGTCTNFQSSVDDSPLVRVLYNIAISQQRPKEFNEKRVEAALQQAGRSWGDVLADAIHVHVPDDTAAAELITAYMDAFSGDYRDRYTLDTAVADIHRVQTCLSRQVLTLDLQRGPGSDLSLKLYTPGQALVLSDILPILENMGLRVATEHPFVITPKGAAQPVMMQDFALLYPTSLDSAAFDHLKPLFEEAFAAVQSGAAENDTLNQLVLRAGLSARQVMAVRTYVRYVRQGVTYSLPYLEQAIIAYPNLAALFVEFFTARFNPNAKKPAKDIDARIAAGLEAVGSLDHDRIWRYMFETLRATLRTNYYQVDENGAPKSYLSIKLDSRALSYLPSPKPYREIFVYSTRMEGVHLRNGRIARGGIRWSDRPEDFRTEVLGLVKAQTVKNAVIVPSGAKGGFILKRPPVAGDRAALQAEGIACYQTLIRGLLDITDNYAANGKILNPKNVVRHDENDPYLVVAADKGTATFSDIANALSLEYGFWLGDGFASGGSAGYDHKAMGITARGAWESVKRHFREMGHDTQKTDFDVVGVGDMAGDVFGNGMLLSPHIRLVGAFNHLHIFCDPAPDAKASFGERQRMFKNMLPWDAYDTKALSKGGRIYKRSDKVLDLTPEIQKRFDLHKSKVSPAELMQAMLRARTDLLYLGGIGTFVKETGETHAQVGDRSNDALRIDAPELRARVVGEGANLGFTQRARIEYAARGGRVNADFVDNSAGVDTSDHEVNIKILTRAIMAKDEGRLTRAARDKLLKSMTDEVASLVLNDNYQQTQAISLIEARASALLPAHQQFMQALERDGHLNRALEFLPDDDTCATRQKQGRGLTRPEIGILVSYAKMRLCDDLLASHVPDHKDLESWLRAYFPRALVQKFNADILAHPLRRDIIATSLSNVMVNRMGPTFALGMAAEYSVNTAAVARAFLGVTTLIDAPRLWAAVEALDGQIAAATQTRALVDIAHTIERLVGGMLATYGDQVGSDATTKQISAPFAGLMKIMQSESGLRAALLPEQFEDYKARLQEYSAAGFPRDPAAFLAVRPKLGLAFQILTLARTKKVDVNAAAAAYYPLGAQFGFSWLRAQIDSLPAGDSWGLAAAQSLRMQLDRVQLKIAGLILSQPGKQKTFAAFAATQATKVADITRQIADLRRTGVKELTMLMVLLQRLDQLFD